MIKITGFRAYRSVNNRSARFSPLERGAVMNFGGVDLYKSFYSGKFRALPFIRHTALSENAAFRRSNNYGKGNY